MNKQVFFFQKSKNALHRPVEQDKNFCIKIFQIKTALYL